MIIQVEPKSWNMQTILLLFDKCDPHNEDEDIRQYLSRFNLEPKRVYGTRIEGQEFQVLSFGGCYLHPGHVEKIAAIQKAAVDREFIAGFILNSIMSDTDQTLSRITNNMSNSILEKVILKIIQNNQTDSTVTYRDNGEALINLDQELIRSEFISASQKESLTK